MPMFNEAEGIADFLFEIDQYCGDILHKIVVVDDCSTDRSIETITRCARTVETPLEILQNSENLGHGPSTVKGLVYSNKLGFPVVSVDGDGQFMGAEIRSALNFFALANFEVLEGVRINRTEPFFRKITSFFTRLLVWFKSWRWPADANTPMRIYREGLLGELLELFPHDAKTPNLLISIISRRQNLKLTSFPVNFIQRRGENSVGSMWRTRRVHIPSKRFVAFCIAAGLEYLRFSLPSEKN